MTLNLFQRQLQLAAFIINLEGVHQNLGTLPFSSGIKTRAQAHFTGNPSFLGRGKTSSHVETNLGKLKQMGTRFCPVSNFAQRFLSSLCIWINSVSASATSPSYWQAGRQCARFWYDLVPIYLHNLSDIIAPPLTPWARAKHESVWCADVHIKTE